MTTETNYRTVEHRTVDLDGADLELTNPIRVLELMDVQAFDEGEFTLGGTADEVRHDVALKAHNGGVALAAYYAHTDDVRTGNVQDPARQVMTDMLADLHHLADALGLDFDYLTGAGEETYTRDRQIVA